VRSTGIKLAKLHFRRSFQRPEFPHAKFGIEFCSLDPAKSLYALNADIVFVPASTPKILTGGGGKARSSRNWATITFTPVDRTGSIDKHGTPRASILVSPAAIQSIQCIQPPDTLALRAERFTPTRSRSSRRSSLGHPSDRKDVACQGHSQIEGRVVIDTSFPRGPREGAQTS